MKSFLLAAGLGTRLRPLTNSVPKALAPIAGKPLLACWLELLERHGITEILINTHYLAEQVRSFVEGWRSGSVSVTASPMHPYPHTPTPPHPHTQLPPLCVTLAHEEELLGSAGTVWEHHAWVGDEQSFFILYADNLSTVDLTAMREFHEQHDGILTLGVFHTSLPHECGIVTVGEDGRVLDFTEKPASPRSDLANGGVYLARHELWDVIAQIPHPQPFDFGLHVLPHLVGRMYAFRIEGYHLDVGTWGSYRRAQRDAAKGVLSAGTTLRD